MISPRLLTVGTDGVGAVAFRVADAAAPGGTPAPVTPDVVLTIAPAVVAWPSMGMEHEAPAPREIFESAKPEPLKTAVPALQVYAPTWSGTKPAGYVSLT